MDIQQRIGSILQEQGYEKYQACPNEKEVYARCEQRIVCVVEVISVSGGKSNDGMQQKTEPSREHQFHSIPDTEELAQHFVCSVGNVHILHLMICDQVTGSLKETNDPFCWIIDTTTNRLLIYENRTPDFYGLRRFIEQGLAEEVSQPFYSEQNMRTARMDSDSQEEISEVKERLRKIPVTVTLLISNVILFLLCAFWPDAAAILYGMGMLQATAVLEQGELWRVITCMFLHADTAHLFSNMIMLFFVGEIIERIMGSLPYLLLYLLSGIAGNLLSMAWDVAYGASGMSLGASGAVFGVMGAMLLLVLAQRHRMHKEVVFRIALGVGCCLYSGFTTAGINNAAHVGGMIGGFVCCGIWLLYKKQKQRRIGCKGK